MFKVLHSSFSSLFVDSFSGLLLGAQSWVKIVAGNLFDTSPQKDFLLLNWLISQDILILWRCLCDFFYFFKDILCDWFLKFMQVVFSQLFFISCLSLIINLSSLWCMIRNGVTIWYNNYNSNRKKFIVNSFGLWNWKTYYFILSSSNKNLWCNALFIIRLSCTTMNWVLRTLGWYYFWEIRLMISMYIIMTMPWWERK